MPMYTMKCDTCARLATVISTIADRDAPRACSSVPVTPETVEPPRFGRREAIKEAYTDCAGTLTRPTAELVDETAKTPYAWKP